MGPFGGSDHGHAISMMDKIKWYIMNVAMNKYLPMAGMAAVTALGTFFAAHTGALEQYGITYGTWPLVWTTGNVPSGPVLLVELDTLSASAIAGIVALVTVIWSATQHHTTPVPPNPTEDKPHA